MVGGKVEEQEVKKRLEEVDVGMVMRIKEQIVLAKTCGEKREFLQDEEENDEGVRLFGLIDVMKEVDVQLNFVENGLLK